MTPSSTVIPSASPRETQSKTSLMIYPLFFFDDYLSSKHGGFLILVLAVQKRFSSAYLKHKLVDSSLTKSSAVHLLETSARLQDVKWRHLIGEVIIYSTVTTCNVIRVSFVQSKAGSNYINHFDDALGKLGSICDVVYSHPMKRSVSTILFEVVGFTILRQVSTLPCCKPHFSLKYSVHSRLVLYPVRH